MIRPRKPPDFIHKYSKTQLLTTLAVTGRKDLKFMAGKKEA